MATSSKFILSASGITFGFTPNVSFLGPLDFHLEKGCIHAIVGPNGAGKSTLLRLLLGLAKPWGGKIEFNGQVLAAMSSNARAREISFLPQKPITPKSITAGEIVRLGRHPYRGFSLFESPDDLEIARESMRLTDTLELESRQMHTLSGGEAQRIHLAAALCQKPTLLALDEPTSGLDLRHQLEVFELIKSLQKRMGLSVIVVTHDLNLATQFSDQVTVLHSGRAVAQGAPGTVLVAEHLEPVYGVRFISVAPQGFTHPWLIAQHAEPVHCSGGGQS